MKSIFVKNFSIGCESSNETLARLDKALKAANILKESHLCVTSDKAEIKDKLKEACRREERVQIARKYCLEEHGGKYYCLKDGKCFGNLCKGCIKHECEVNGTKQILNPPEEYYVKNVQRPGDDSPKYDINVDDKKGIMHFREWCTLVPNKYA